MATKVKALKTGFYNGRRYRPGKTFILKDGHKPGKWMENLGEVEAPPKAKEPKAKEQPAKDPTTFSELTKASVPKSAKDHA